MVFQILWWRGIRYQASKKLKIIAWAPFRERMGAETKGSQFGAAKPRRETCTLE